ncbi:MAG: dipeptide epimerase [Thaumarchaeota archaeon]|nr:dipeptide epimerase [Nitrososphaerota archaeon]
MRIKRIEVSPVNISFRSGHALTASYGEVSPGSVLVKIHTDNGLVGYGEGAPYLPTTGDTQRSVIDILGVIAPKLIDEFAFNIGKIHQMLDRSMDGNPSVRSAIDLALYDLQGKFTKTPVYRLLGGAYKEEVPMHYTLGIKSPEEMAADAAAKIEEGYRALEVKVGGGIIEDDVERVKRIRDAVGDDVILIVDPNTGWSPASSINAIKQIEKHDVYVEQPTKTLEGLARVRSSVSAPIIADEICRTPDDVQEIIRRNAADAINIKLLKFGGFYKAQKAIAIAESAGLGYRFDSRPQTRLASTASLHLSMASGREIASGYVQFMRQKEDLVAKGGIIVSKGVASLTDKNAPGLGVEIREELLGPASVYGKS